MSSPRWLRHHVLSGLCSGFPLCCLVFFCLIWSRGPWPRGELRGWRRWYSDWLFQSHRRWGYVPCPLCAISGARLPVRKCDDRCQCLARCEALLRRNG